MWLNLKIYRSKNGDSKEKWHDDYFFAKDCSDRIVYTDDFCFVKGFDYRLTDVR